MIAEIITRTTIAIDPTEWLRPSVLSQYMEAEGNFDLFDGMDDRETIAKMLEIDGQAALIEWPIIKEELLEARVV